MKTLQTNLSKLSATEILQTSHELLTEMPAEYLQYNLVKFVLCYLIKRLQPEFESWDIKESTIDFNYNLMQEVQQHIIEILKLKEKKKYEAYVEDIDANMKSELEDKGTFDAEDLDKIMTKLISDTWLPTMRSFIVTKWNPKEDHMLIDLIEHWQGLIPKGQLTELYDAVIFPKLQKEVENWNPTQDRMMIHIWIHPWLPLLGEKRIESLWKPIQFKLSTILQQWHPSDNSAFALLSPWLKVFDQSTWENLITRTILPKLIYALKDFEVNPKNQKVEPIKWLLQWQDFIAPEHLVGLLENYVLKKLMDVCEKWLQLENASVNEMIIWLNGWKTLLGKKLMLVPVVQRYFNVMSDKINKKGPSAQK
jgi:tuftelin-interacting protein 11